VKQPRLLIMDEPTNHLGTGTVVDVLDAVGDWPAPPTVLIISHDPELLSRIPTVFRLQSGVLMPVRAVVTSAGLPARV
jgi:ATPase subunit of ABC transporter with duplicated ATPase domains